MQIKILIDINEGKEIVMRVTNPGSASGSDDVKDKMVRMFLEEIGIRSGLLSVYYDPSGDAIIRPADCHIALSTIAGRFYGDHKVKMLINDALDELNKTVYETSGSPE